MTTRTKLIIVLCAIVLGVIAFFLIKPPPLKVRQPVKLEMRAFKVDPNTFYTALLNNALRNHLNMQTNTILTDAENLFNQLGVDLTAPGRSIAFDDKLGLLFVKATPSELDTIERVIQTLNQTAPQIHIKTRFVEVPESEVESILKAGVAVGARETNTVEIVTADKMKLLQSQLKTGGGVETLAEPEVVASSGRQTQMSATEIKTVVTGINPLALKSPGVSSNKLFLTQKVGFGPVLDEIPYVLSDGYTLNLTTIASVTEFLGYAEPTNSVIAYIDGQRQTVPVPLPKIRSRKMSSCINLFDGQTLILGKPDEQLTGPAGESNDNKKELLVFVTAAVLDSAGNRVYSEKKLPFNPSTIPPQPKIPTPSP